MSNDLLSSVLSSDNSRIQFVNESQLLLGVSDEKSTIINSKYEVSSEEDVWLDIERTKKKLKPGMKTRGRVKIKMEFVKDKVRRFTTFSKRKTGLMKKAYELAKLTGAQLLLLVASETGHVYTFATDKLKPIIDRTEGQDLIEACLNKEMESEQALKRPHDAFSEPPPKPTTFKKNMLVKPASHPPTTTASLVSSKLVNMVVKPVQPGELTKIVLPIDLSQRLRYRFEERSNDMPNGDNADNKNINNSWNKNVFKVNNTKHKMKNIQLNKSNNNSRSKNQNVNRNTSQLKSNKSNNNEDSNNNITNTDNNYNDIVKNLQNNFKQNNSTDKNSKNLQNDVFTNNNVSSNNTANNLDNINNYLINLNNNNFINNIIISTNLNTLNTEQVVAGVVNNNNILVNNDAFNINNQAHLTHNNFFTFKSDDNVK